MKNNNKLKKLPVVAAAAIIAAVMGTPTQVMAAEFDPVFYMTLYADVATAFGSDAEALYNHYITYGQKEGRIPFAGAEPGEAVDGIVIVDTAAVVDTPVAADTEAINGIVPIDKLQNYASLKKNMTDNEFQMAYNAALNIVQPLTGLSKEEQVVGIMLYLRYMVDSGQMTYSTSYPHYNDAYGYLVNHVASCAGSARTTGLCLNMLDINYEHVHESQWCHQWCRADLDGKIWVVDPYAYTCTEELYAYWHPLADCGQ